MASPPLRGPGFSTYPADDVAWLLDDYSSLALEADQSAREADIQSGRAHYAQSLPVEYRPGPAYVSEFELALASQSGPVARAAARVADDLAQARRGRPVLVSLARAGVPAGILLRRLGRRYFDQDWPHYAVSIVRGRGLDGDALAWIVDHHDPLDVVFVDAWTGKGAIRGELTAALAAGAWGVADEHAVLADPAQVADFAGTHDDLLVPSACLNATVSGLISRTVLPPPGWGPRHGAKFYRDLEPADRSLELIERLVAEAPTVPLPGLGLLRPRWVGTDLVRRLQATYGLESTHLVKPGIGETTRVLLRRVPWLVLVSRESDPADPSIRHIRLLAQERGVPVETADLGPYRTVGIIRPVSGGQME